MMFDVGQRAGSATLRLYGEFDVMISPWVADLISGILATRPRRLLVDVRQVSFVDSTAVNVLVRAAKQARQIETALAVVNPIEAVRLTFNLTGLDHILPIYDTLARADRGTLFSH
jgi:anti-sigma B factor antagonist